MIIEFYGIPASGKTTHMNAILEKYKNSEKLMAFAENANKSEKLRCILTAEFISFFFKAAMMFLKKKNKVKYDAKLLYYFCGIYLSCMYCRNNGTFDYYVNDHGIIQNIVSAMWDNKSLLKSGKKIIAHTEKYFKNEIAFVYTVNGDNKELFSRIKNRNTVIRLKSYSFEDSEPIYNVQREIFEEITEDIKNGFRFIEIDSSADFDVCFEKICGFIDNLK